MIKLTRNLVQSYVDEGLVTARPHSDYPNLVILNYTPETAFGKKWDDFTIRARGLIFDMDKEEVLSNPFPKFFNLGEDMETLAYFESDKKFEVLEKLDGSLGISYFYDGKVRWATRGSFHSEQAQKAQEIWDTKYPEGAVSYDPRFTLLVEIIYPENRIVVDYKDKEELVLLGVRHIETGDELEHIYLRPLANMFGMPVAKRYFYNKKELLTLQKTLPANEEGFILRYEDGFRLKIKGEKYVATHKLIFGLNEKHYVDAWIDGISESLLASIPEEFRAGYEELQKKLDLEKTRFEAVVGYNYKKFSKLTKKDLGLAEDVSPEVKSVVFMMIDKRQGVEKKIRDIVGSKVLSEL